MKTLLVMLVGIYLVLATPVYAHHSQAEFGGNQLEEMQGEIIGAYWRNPHVNFTLKTLDQNGNEEIWEMEAGAWNALSRRGVPKDAVTAGDMVTVAVTRSSKRSSQLRLSNILILDSGVEVVFGNGAPRWANQGTNQAFGGSGGAASASANTAPADTSGDGLYQIWSIAGGRRVPLDGELPLTEQARVAQAAWDPITEDPLLLCIPPGMPSTMGNPYPMQFSERDGNIVIHLEEFDNVRTIHMDPYAEVGAAGPLGHSVGRWQDGSLLVETTNINHPYFNRVGVAQSTEVTTSERFTLSDDSRRLDYSLTITDPNTLTEPVSWSTYYASGRGEEIKAYECTVERYVPR
jgi:hypothetical protein